MTRLSATFLCAMHSHSQVRGTCDKTTRDLPSFLPHLTFMLISNLEAWWIIKRLFCFNIYFLIRHTALEWQVFFLVNIDLYFYLGFNAFSHGLLPCDNLMLTHMLLFFSVTTSLFHSCSLDLIKSCITGSNTFVIGVRTTPS